MSNTYGEVTQLRQVRAEAENKIHQSPTNTLVWIMNLAWLRVQQEEQLPLSQSIKNKEGSRSNLLKGCTLCSTQSFPLFSKNLANLQSHLSFSEYMKDNKINISDKLHLKERSKYLNEVQKQQGKTERAQTFVGA